MGAMRFGGWFKNTLESKGKMWKNQKSFFQKLKCSKNGSIFKKNFYSWLLITCFFTWCLLFLVNRYFLFLRLWWVYCNMLSYLKPWVGHKWWIRNKDKCLIILHMIKHCTKLLFIEFQLHWVVESSLINLLILTGTWDLETSIQIWEIVEWRRSKFLNSWIELN